MAAGFAKLKEELFGSGFGANDRGVGGIGASGGSGSMAGLLGAGLAAAGAAGIAGAGNKTMINANNRVESVKPNLPQQPKTNSNSPQPSINQSQEESGSVNAIDQNTWMQWMEEEQQKRWEREDQIRKETQEREDTAYQRAVADAKKAGVNPNLIGLNPAASGGGITQASGLDTNAYNIDMDKFLTELEMEINNAFEKGENLKDNIFDIIGNVISTLAFTYFTKKIK